jgi:general secretion pathway protein E
MGEIEEAARQYGMRTMYEDGLLKAMQGQTTIEEVLRVTQEA